MTNEHLRWLLFVAFAATVPLPWWLVMAAGTLPLMGFAVAAVSSMASPSILSVVVIAVLLGYSFML
jgi:hypothetical protein